MADQSNRQYVKIVNNLPYAVVFVSKFQDGGVDTTNSLRPGQWLAFYRTAIHCIGVHTVGGNTSGGHYPSSACLDPDASVLVSINPSGIAVTHAVPDPALNGDVASGITASNALGATASGGGQEGQVWPSGVGFRCSISGSVNQGRLDLTCQAQSADGATPAFPGVDHAFCTPSSRGLECRFL
nr:hypothetical protein [Pandoravirus belohorizontensis]